MEERNVEKADQSWRALYAAGAAMALLFIVMCAVPIALVFAVQQPPSTGGAAVLEYIAAHKAVYWTEYVCFVGLCIPALVVFTALPLLLKEASRPLAAAGALFGIVSETLGLAVNASPPSLHGGLIHLSGLYAAAATDAQRLALSTAAEGFMATANAVNAIGILTALAILLLSLAMLKGPFNKPAAVIGIVTGALGMVFEALRDQIGMLYTLYGCLLPAWFGIAGWGLFRASRGIGLKGS
jgi:hypothetical protein